MSNYKINGKITIKDSAAIIGDVVNSNLNLNYTKNEKEILEPLISLLPVEKKAEVIDAYNTISSNSTSKENKLSAGKIILEIAKGALQGLGKKGIEVIVNLVTTKVPELSDYSNQMLAGLS